MAVSDDDRTTTRARIVADICGRIAGGSSVAQVFVDPGEGYPSETTFWKWLSESDELDTAYCRATEKRAEKLAEEVVTLADAEPPQVNGAYGTHIDSGWVKWNQTRIDSRKWVAARMRPKRWGDRTILAGDADNPIAFDDPKAAILGRLNAGAAPSGATGDSGKPDD